MVCEECGFMFYADADADVARCPRPRCAGEIDLNESRRKARREWTH
jgi:predicted Zn-ribbon and HTH transcriptional regulator